MPLPSLIGVDWGTSSLRAYLIDGSGTVIERRASDRGILSVEAGQFESVLRGVVGDWHRDHRSLPILMSGMIGSRQGWNEAPYVACPADLGAISAHLLRFDAGDLGPIAIVPGLTVDTGGVPDVMRGEETQLFGAIAHDGSGEGHFVLPGTHSKWVRVVERQIVRFDTYMTGEVYAALKAHTILGRLMAPGPASDAAFLRGVDAGAAAGGPGALLNRIFSARTLGLFERLAGSDIGDYLSGIVIGAEIADAATARQGFTLIGSDALVHRYEMAAAHLGHATRRAPADCVTAGHVAIAIAAGLTGDSR